MKTITRVLWIEDGARFDLQELAAPVIVDGRFELVIAENVTEGVEWLTKEKFDVIIVDIRLPPGPGEKWIELYRESREKRKAARLGRHLLFTILHHDDAEVKIDQLPKGGIVSSQVGVLSVETRRELEADLTRLNIKHCETKHAGTPNTLLLDLIERVQKGEK